MAELSSERRTPRKLNTPSTSPATSKKSALHRGAGLSNGTPARVVVLTPAANSGQRRQPFQNGIESNTRPIEQTSSAPRNVPLKLEKRGQGKTATPKASNGNSPVVTKSVPIRTSSVSSVESPFDSTGKDPLELKGATLRMSAPRTKGIAPNPTEQSPLVSRSVKRVPTIVMNGKGLSPPIMSPTPSQLLPKVNGHGGLELTTQRVKRVPQRPKPGMSARSTNSARSTIGTETDAQSTASSRSRKRKFADRTSNRSTTGPPNGASNIADNNTTSNFRRTSSYAASSRSVSVAGGPRKLSRISSVVKAPNGSRGPMSVDLRKDTSSSNTSRSANGQQKPRPPKLATNGHRTAKARNDTIATN